MKYAKENAIVVLTARGPKKILEEGGSQAWRLNPSHAKRAEFLVCVQNTGNGDWGGASEPHATAFLIGRISEIVPSPERSERWIVKISDYARIEIPNVWKAWRYPVRYMSLSELGIDPAKLKFKPMPKLITASSSLGDVIANAKLTIASVAGVPVEAIRISVDLA